MRKCALVFWGSTKLCVALRDFPDPNHGNPNVLRDRCVDPTSLLTALRCILALVFLGFNECLMSLSEEELALDNFAS
jgi:hypothetical protein